jgi:ABC-type transport system involved in multi-copper enzyme maturation permease subunit
MRWGLGPVFVYECQANSRRWQTYALRSAGVALLLVAIAMIETENRAIKPSHSWRHYAALGEAYFYAIIGVELSLVMLAAPAATAGAICVDRARGTLAHMLATELSDGEIVLGKLSARLLPVLVLVACSWPVLAICSLLGGIDPMSLALAFAIILTVALLGCTLALALSVWARKPHEVVLVVYTAWMLVLLPWPIWLVLARSGLVGPPAAWTLLVDPYYVAFAPYAAPGRLDLWDYLGFFAVTLGASAALSGLAVWRMRPVARRGTDERRKEPGFGLIGRLSRRLPGPSLDGNPVLWREWHRARPSRWVMILVALVGGSTGIACLIGTVMVWMIPAGGRPVNGALILGIGGALLQLIFGLLMLSAVGPLAMSEERQRGSLDLLTATPLSTPTIVLGKWLGALRFVPLLALAPGLMAFAFATASIGPWPMPPGFPPEYYEPVSRGVLLSCAGLVVATVLVHGALIASVGLALAAWIARQGRAIALSVAFAVMVIAGWPILVAVIGPGAARQPLSSLSPFMAIMDLLSPPTMRVRMSNPQFWPVIFWEIECVVLAAGLLWLTVRTFDAGFGRIPERPRRAPIQSDVAVVLAGLIGAGGLLGALELWAEGVGGLRPALDHGIVASVFLIWIGFLLLSAQAASSLSGGATAPALAPGSAALSGRRVFARRWWEAYRPVLLLAIGPALLALGLATASRPVVVVTKVTPTPGGGSVRIATDFYDGHPMVTTTDASGKVTTRDATEAEIAAAGTIPPPPRDPLVGIAVVAIITVLAHGAAFVAMGAALGVWIRRRDRAIAASMGLILLVTVGWPILNLLLDAYPHSSWGWTLASIFPAFSTLLFRIKNADAIENMTGWAAYWDMVLILAAAIASALAVRTLGRRCRKAPLPERPPEGAVGCPASTEPALAEHG